MEVLSKIAETEPHCAYTAFTSGFRGKFNYFLRTIPGIEEYLDPVENIIRTMFIPMICNDNERNILALPPKLGGLGLINVKESSGMEFRNSIEMTEYLTSIIKRDSHHVHLDEKELEQKMKETKNKIRQRKRDNNKIKLEEIRSNLDAQAIKINDANQEKGTYNWLTVLLLEEHKFYLSKEEFKDAIRMRYNWAMPRLPHARVENDSVLNTRYRAKRGVLSP